VAKSLVVADVSGTQSRFRLLSTTSVYASEKLLESGEHERISRRQAEHYYDLFERAENEALARPANEWLTDYAREIDNLRSALDWAFSPNGDASIGVALTAAAVPLWTRLSLLLECRSRVERALAALPAGSADARHEMKLQAALGASLNFTGGTVREILIAWTSALDLAEKVGDIDYQLRALFGLWTHETQLALAYARQFAALAVTPADRLVGERMVGISSFHRGDHSDARQHLERVIADGSAHHSGSSIRFQFDEQLVARTFLALILWLQGFPNQATHMAEDAVERARAADHPNSLCQALARAGCPVALWVGDLELAERNIELLRDHSTRHGLTGWRAYHRTYQGLLLIKRGDLQDGIALLRIGFGELDAAFSSWGISMFIGELADALGLVGQTAEALATVDEAIERSGRTEEGWIVAELLRIKAELLLLQGEHGSGTVAEDHFQQAIDRSRRQGALSWELRVATSAARWLRDQGRQVDAISSVERVYDRFTEGFGTADLIAAKRLLDEIGDAPGH
jgi:predicted ATPase